MTSATPSALEFTFFLVVFIAFIWVLGRIVP
jgi:hypothetical protein